MKIKTAKFLISNSDYKKCPKEVLPEYAFIGRSNVGKSSLINMLTGNSKLAMTSSTPGKTLLINHFLINEQWFLVDLPGYGYAKRSKTQTEKLQDIIAGYILDREQLTCVFLLIDSRLEPQKIDLEFIEWLGENQIPFVIVFTKADKLSKGAVSKNVTLFLNHLKKTWEELPSHFISSSVAQLGKEEILNYIDSINQQLEGEK